MSRNFATLCGLTAVFLWGALALLAGLAGSVPPFQMTAFAFLIAGLLGVAVALVNGRAAALRPTPISLALGLYGLFVYHACYFAALKLAPPAEVNLIASFWALFIVLFSALLPGHSLKPRHVLGALIGLAAGLVLIWPRLGAGTSEMRAFAGLALAFACALIWSSYSVASRLVTAPSESIAIACLATSVLALFCHLAFETTSWPADRAGWIGLLGLGLGPVGAAFYLWDIGMKRGDVSLLGVLSYAQPVIATSLLVLFGFASPTMQLALAVLLTLTAALVATWEIGAKRFSSEVKTGSREEPKP